MREKTFFVLFLLATVNILYSCASEKSPNTVDVVSDTSRDVADGSTQKDTAGDIQNDHSGDPGQTDLAHDIESDGHNCSSCRPGEECVDGACLFVLVKDRVKIIRDRYGIPHIYAKDNYSLFFGEGYAQAQDHAKEMVVNLLASVTRCSEFFGRETCFEADMAAAKWNIENTASSRFMGMDEQEKAAYDGFVDGINEYLAEHGAELGEPFDRVRIAPYMVVALAMMANISRAQSVLRKELRNFKNGTCGEYPSGPQESNEWVVGPQMSSTGHVYVQSDPHLPWYGGNHWYEVHLHGGDYDVMGATFFGTPAVIMGHNQHVAWAFTANSPDTADWYYLKLNPDNPHQYWWGGGWKDFDVWHKSIKIKGEPDKYRFEVLESVHGFIMETDESNHYALAAATYANQLTGVVAQFLELDRAGSVDDVKKAFSKRQAIRWNVVAGDSQGHIMYLWNATVAQRPDGIDPTCPIDGSSTSSGWKKMYDFNALPYEKDPDDGWFQNCNTAPWKVNIHTAIKQGDYPSWVVPPKDNFFGPRGERSTELITKNAKKLDYDAMKKISMDTYLITARQVIKTTLDVYNEIGQSMADTKGRLKDVINRLKAWDLSPDLDDETASLVLFFGEKLHQQSPNVSVGDFPLASDLNTQQKQGLLKLWMATAQTLVDIYGSTEVPLKQVNVIERGGKLFGVGTFGGQWQPLRIANCDSFRDGKCYLNSGSSYLMLTELGPSGVVHSESSFPLSESEDPKSPHYTDVTTIYAKGKYKPAYFSMDDVLNNAESAIELDTKKKE